MKTRQVACLAVALILVCQIIVLASAETNEEIWAKPPVVKVTGPTFWERIVNLFRTEEFTIVGQDRLCDTEPLMRSGGDRAQITYLARGKWLGYWQFDSGTVAGGNSMWEASNFCGSGHGLFDVYCQTNALAPVTDLGTPRFENQDSFYFNCLSAAQGGTCAHCNVELYCCPEDCGAGDACPSGGTCTTKIATDPYMPLRIPGSNTPLTSYKYCVSGSCSGSKTCWRIGSSNTCESTTYSCTYSNFDKINADCGSGYSGYFIYNSEADCKSGICVPKTCAQLGRTCGSVSNGCGKTLSCGPCQDGYTCSTEGKCIAGGCTAVGGYCLSDSSCCSKKCTSFKCIAAPTPTPCTNKDCANIGACTAHQVCDANGNLGACVKKDASCGTLSCNKDTEVEKDGVCKLKSEVCVKDGGTKTEGCDDTPVTPVKENERTLMDKVTIVSMSYGTLDGKSLKLLTPGQMIKVDFNIKADVPSLYGPYLIEAGLIPLSTAKVWGMDKEYGGYSIFNLYAVGESSRDACCVGQPNIVDNYYEYKSWELLPWRWFNTEKVQTFSFKIQVPDKDTKDICGSQTYWDEVNPEYILYIIVKNGCHKDGYRRNVFMTKTVELNLTSVSKIGRKCENDFNCEEEETCQDIIGDYSSQKYCALNAGGEGNPASTSLIDLKKSSLTRTEINKATSPQLLTSVCKLSSECLERANNTVSCVSIKSLRDAGTITEAQQKDLFAEAKRAVNYIVGGATSGAIVGLIACIPAAAPGAATGAGVGALAGAPVGGIGAAPGAAAGAVVGGITTYVSCAALGAAIGGGVGYTASTLHFREDDELVSYLKAEDANQVGICTAEPSTTFDLGGILKKIGNAVKITGNPSTDGIIVILGGIFILFIFMSMMNKK